MIPYLDKFLGLFRPNQTKTSGAVGFNELAYAANHMSVDQLAAILREAEIGSVDRLFALYRDIISGHSHLQAEVNTRKLAVLGDPISFAPRDKTRPEDVLAAKACERLKECETWNLGRNHLLNGCLYPLAIVEKIYKPAAPNELGLRFDLAELSPVKYQAITFQDRARLQLWDFDEHTGLRMASKFTPEPEQYIIHRGHLLTQMPDYWGGPLRAGLFWWLFSVMDRDWWVRFLARFGTPFIVGKYNSANPKDKSTLTRAFSAASQLLGLVISKDTEIEVTQAATKDTGEAFQKMHEIANRELSKLILGQTSTSEAQPSALGGSQAQVHNTVRGDIKQFDATTLAHTLENQLCKQYLAINGLTGSVKIITGSAGPEEIKAAANVVKTAADSGLQLTDAGIEQFSEVAGLPFQRAPLPTAASATPSGLSADIWEVLRPNLLFRRGLREDVASTPRPLSAGASALPAYLPTNAELDSIAQTGAEGLAAAFHGIFAPVRQLILSSQSAADLEARLRVWYADHNPSAAAELIESALTAYTANGAAAHRR
jgi:phage gp29-like protein